MATKDPHVAVIDAHEKLEKIKAQVKAARRLIEAKTALGIKPTPEDVANVKAIVRQAIDAARWVQDELFEELESHGKVE